jgi:hypothetical protein
MMHENNEILNKRDILSTLSRMGELLRGHPEKFLMVEENIQPSAAEIRLNNLGKAMNIAAVIIKDYKDGEPLTGNLKEWHFQYVRLMKECMKPYE